MIKSCPFCNFNEGWTIIDPLDENRFRIKCNVCYSYGPSGSTEDKAKLLWNGALKKIDNQKQFTQFLSEMDGYISSPIATLGNTPGMGNVQPAQIAATIGSQQASDLSKGSGDNFGQIGKIQMQKSKKKKKKHKIKTLEDFANQI